MPSIVGCIVSAAGVWSDLMANHFGDEESMHFPIDVRILVEKHDYTGLIRQKYYLGAINPQDWKRKPWMQRHRSYNDLCRIAQDFHAGEYPVVCNEKKRRWKCRNCPLA